MRKDFWKNALMGLIVLGVAAYLLLGLFFGGSTFYEVFEESWGIVLPEGEDIYTCTMPADFLGDGDRYYVIGYDAHTDLSQVVAWEERSDDRAVEALQSIWRYDDFQPEEMYLPQVIKAPYGYCAKNKNGRGDQLVMIWGKQMELGGKVYEQVLFIGERHS